MFIHLQWEFSMSSIPENELCVNSYLSESVSAALQGVALTFPFSDIWINTHEKENGSRGGKDLFLFLNTQEKKS